MLSMNIICFFQLLLPSPLTDDDVNQLLQHCMTSSQKSSSQVFSDGVVISNQFINECKKIFEPIMKEKAENVSRTFDVLRHCLIENVRGKFWNVVSNILLNVLRGGARGG